MKNVFGNIFNFAVYLPLKRLKFNFSCAKMYLTVKLSRVLAKTWICIFSALRRVLLIANVANGFVQVSGNLIFASRVSGNLINASLVKWI